MGRLPSCTVPCHGGTLEDARFTSSIGRAAPEGVVLAGAVAASGAVEVTRTSRAAEHVDPKEIAAATAVAHMERKFMDAMVKRDSMRAIAKAKKGKKAKGKAKKKVKGKSGPDPVKKETPDATAEAAPAESARRITGKRAAPEPASGERCVRLGCSKCRYSPKGCTECLRKALAMHR